ncbi:MAG: DUF1566 domain-containing protein [Fimbriimonadaceae bacterium]|nr:DUF1566 domain-containing protein [Fimbriimonadaceae bacterium]
MGNRWQWSGWRGGVALGGWSWLASAAWAAADEPLPYPVVDTGQVVCFDTQRRIAAPAAGQPLAGQDAQHAGHQPAYRNNGDGTVSDLVTGLTWVQAMGNKLTWDQAAAGAAGCRVGGHQDWRFPSIKELYSLILFSGLDPSGPPGYTPPNLTPFLDRSFEFTYGDERRGERIIDCQIWSATKYVGQSHDQKVFGVNFADGRIKGYPSRFPDGRVHQMYVRYCRGGRGYGRNQLSAPGNGTVVDAATGLVWSQADSGRGMSWPEALAYATAQNAAGYLGHRDWRLPNVKELQSIVDYARSPDSTRSAAIDPLFGVTPIRSEGGQTDYPFYWSSTTHESQRGGSYACYVCFGEAGGFVSPPWGGPLNLVDVHGAGAQRSDPKVGDPAAFPRGHGPQGDVVRISNFVRLVRDR